MWKTSTTTVTRFSPKNRKGPSQKKRTKLPPDICDVIAKLRTVGFDDEADTIITEMDKRKKQIEDAVAGYKSHDAMLLGHIEYYKDGMLLAHRISSVLMVMLLLEMLRVIWTS